MREAETDVPVLTKSVERSEGTASYAARRLTTRDLAWADVVGAMESRHVASIARMRGNFVYVAPDSPSSAHGVKASMNEHWQAGCAQHACPGGRAAR